MAPVQIGAPPTRAAIPPRIARNASESTATTQTIIVCGTVMTVWLGQDGFDYSFQGDYDRMWDDTLSALAERGPHGVQGVLLMAFGDEPKPGVQAALATLRARGLRLVMISGDNAGAAQAMKAHVQNGLSVVVASLKASSQAPT